MKTVPTSIRFASLILFSLALGCSQGNSEHGHVVGVVTINGEPVEGATVTFAPQEGGRSAIAITEADGSYELNYTPGVKGAKIGTNTVTISTYVEPTRDDNNRVIEPGTAERFPPEYSQGEKTVEVEAGENRFDFEVEADKESYPVRR